MAHRRQGYRFENDWPLEELKKSNYETRKNPGVTLPVNLKIEGGQRVLSFDKAKDILHAAKKISVIDCPCRTKRRNCDAPLNTCFDLNNMAEFVLGNKELKDRHPREVTLNEALDILEMTHEAGLVHMAYVNGDEGPVNSMCSCCSCCCHVLSAVLRFGLAPHYLSSQTTTVTDSSMCTGCGVCADRCQFGAREMVDGSLTFKPELCFGCGLCVSKCPTGAIKIVYK